MTCCKGFYSAILLSLAALLAAGAALWSVSPNEAAGQDRRAPRVAKAAATAVSLPGQWPQWRGPQRDGVSRETGLLQEWPKDGPRLIYDVRGLGSGYSSVVVAEGRIYTLGNLKNKESMVALSAEDGKVLWTTPFRDGGGHSNSTPTVDGDRVYVVGREGDLVCCDTESGKIVWQKNFQRDFGGKMMSGWGYSESPLIDGERLICTPGAQDAILAALDKKTGETIWKAPMPAGGRHGGDGAAYSSIVVSNGGGVKQYVQLVGRGVIGVEAGKGQFLWGYDLVANGTANIPTPIVKGNYVFASTGYGTGAALIELTGSRGKVNAREVYFKKADEFQNHHGGMVELDGYIYAGTGHNNGIPICLEMRSGKAVWGGNKRGAGSGSAAVVYADGNLIFRYEDGVVALIEATPKQYNLKSKFTPVHQEDKSWAHPVVAGGRLYLREQDHLMCYDLTK